MYETAVPDQISVNYYEYTRNIPVGIVRLVIRDSIGSIVIAFYI